MFHVETITFLLVKVLLFSALAIPRATSLRHPSKMMRQMHRIPQDVELFALQESASANEVVGSGGSDGSILLQYETKHPESANAAAAFAASIQASRPKMVVFDKDGTLGDCTASLKRWVLHMTCCLRENLTSSPAQTEHIIDEFYQQIGWDSTSQNVVPSAPVAAGTWDGVMELVYQFLLKHSSKCKEPVSLELLLKWHHELGDVHGQDQPLLDDLKGMMLTCQRLGYLVGVCTSDDRAATDIAMKSWGIDQVVDVSICGDEVSQGKPSAVPLQAICLRASTMLQRRPGVDVQQISPQNCIMVGDTSSDTGTATAAKAGFCVGVLTGSGTAEQLLATGAHLILPHVGHIPALLETLEGLAFNSQEGQ